MSRNKLADHRRIWKNKPLLREIYADWYKMIISHLVTGKTVELGSGTGNFKEYYPPAIATDIDPHPWLDMVFDAHKMPFKKASVSNLVMVDTLHHLADPVGFLNESARVLRRQGKIIMIEPYPSPVSKMIYKIFHPEPFIYDVDYFNLKQTAGKKPWDSNQAIPYLIFFKNRKKFESRFKNIFKITMAVKFSTITYPLSGGFEGKQILPDKFKGWTDRGEQLLLAANGWLAFRCLVVLERT